MRLADPAFQHQIGNVDGVMGAIGECQIGGFRPVGSMLGRPPEAAHGKAPAGAGLQNEAGRRRVLVEIGVAQQERRVLASRIVHDARQRRIGEFEVADRRVGEVDEGKDKPA